MKLKKEQLVRLLESTKEVMLISSQIELSGNHHALIQGAKGILEYNEEYVKIKLVEQDVCFYGEKLSIESLTQDSMELKGKISRLEYSS